MLLTLKLFLNTYPLPRIKETLELLIGAKYLSMNDFVQGYHLVSLDDKEIGKSVFVLDLVHYLNFTRAV